MKTKIYITILATLMSFGTFAQANLAGNTLDYTGENTVDFGQVDFNFTDQMTIMFWAKWSIDPANGSQWSNMVTMNSETHGDRGQFWIQHSSNNSKFEFALATLGSNGQMSRNFLYSTTTPQQDVWYHIAVTYDGSQMKLYVNGVLENSRNKSGNIYTYQSDFVLTVASWAASNYGRSFVGQIDELSIWNVAKTEEEIGSIMNNLLMGYEPGLAAYYRFDVVEDNIVRDLSGNSINGTNVGINGGDPALLSNSTAPIFGTLPVELVSFDAFTNTGVVELNWKTASEINNDYFTIYRSVDGFAWEVIGTVDGAGNANQMIAYSFVDNNPTSTQLYYKLRQTDFDGKFEEFDVISVKAEIVLVEVQLYPNPANDFLNINLGTNDLNSNVSVMVYNQTGQILMQQDNVERNFNNLVSIDLSDFTNGSYFVNIQYNGETIYNSNFMVIK